MDDIKIDEAAFDGRFPALARVITLFAEGEVDRGLDELAPLITCSDPDLQPRAVLLLARVNEARGNTEYMLNAYQTAAESGHPEIAPLAALELGAKLTDLGQPRMAKRWLKQAARAADPEIREAAGKILQIGRKRRR